MKIFSQFVGCHFVLLTASFALQKLCNFMMSHLSILDLRAQAIGVLLGKFPPVATFSSISFSVSGFMWRSLIYLDFSFVQGDKNDSIFILLHASFVENAIFFSPMDNFSPFDFLQVCGFISESSVLFH